MNKCQCVYYLKILQVAVAVDVGHRGGGRNYANDDDLDLPKSPIYNTQKAVKTNYLEKCCTYRHTILISEVTA